MYLKYYPDYYVLNELFIVELNTEKKSDINLSNELNRILSFVKKNPDLKDFVSIAADGLSIYIYSFIAFKKENGIVKSDTVYRIYFFLDCEPPRINVKKIASRFQVIFGDPEHVFIYLRCTISFDKNVVCARIEIPSLYGPQQGIPNKLSEISKF